MYSKAENRTPDNLVFIVFLHFFFRFSQEEVANMSVLGKILFTGQVRVILGKLTNYRSPQSKPPLSHLQLLQIELSKF